MILGQKNFDNKILNKNINASFVIICLLYTLQPSLEFDAILFKLINLKIWSVLCKLLE